MRHSVTNSLEFIYMLLCTTQRFFTTAKNVAQNLHKKKKKCNFVALKAIGA